MARLVERQAFELDALVAVVGRRAAQYRVDARHELARRERLGHVVIGAAFETGDLVALLGPGREHDDGQLAGFAVALQRARELEAAHVGQHPVDEDEVRAAIGE